MKLMADCTLIFLYMEYNDDNGCNNTNIDQYIKKPEFDPVNEY